MDDALPLVAEVLRRKLPEHRLKPGEHKLAGTALVDCDATIAKSERVTFQPTLPWKSIVAVLCMSMGDSATQVMKRAARKAIEAPDGVPLPERVEKGLEEIRATMPEGKKEGPTKVTGDVAVIAFVTAEIVLPGWREVKEALAEFRRQAAA